MKYVQDWLNFQVKVVLNVILLLLAVFYLKSEWNLDLNKSTYLIVSVSDPAYRDCTLEAVEAVTRDTNLYTLRLPAGCHMSIPVGYHVHIRHKVEGKLEFPTVSQSLKCYCFRLVVLLIFYGQKGVSHGGHAVTVGQHPWCFSSSVTLKCVLCYV